MEIKSMVGLCCFVWLVVYALTKYDTAIILAGVYSAAYAMMVNQKELK